MAAKVDIFVKREFPTSPPYPDPPGSAFVTDPSMDRAIVKAPFGWGAREPRTVMELLDSNVANYGDHVYMRWKPSHEGEYTEITWKQFHGLALRAAKSFIALGLEPHYAVSIMGFNSPEWVIANIGAIMAGGMATGVYTTNNSEACHWVADNSRSQVVLVETAEYLERFMEIRDQLKHCKAFVQWRTEPEKQDDVYGWEAFMRLGESVGDDVLQARIDEQKVSNCCTLIYTSGTTGNPKGVMLSHDNLTWQTQACVETLGMHPGQSFVGYLPLSHIAAQLLDIYFPMCTGSKVTFAQPDALKGTLVKTMKEALPTMFFGVPRVWEKFMEGMKAKGKSNGALKKSLASWAKSLGTLGHDNLEKGEPLPWGFNLADMLIFSKVRNALGLDNIACCATAAAPIPREVHEFFRSLNLPIVEGYGASENCGICSVSLVPYKGSVPTVGINLPGCEIKLADPDKDGNGEIMTRGRNVFMGYLFNEEATAETIEPDGYYHSGDLGKYDERGYLTITGRIKELLITTGGENVAPILMEDNVKQELGSFVSDVMLIGDQRKYISMVITVKSVMSPEGAPLPEVDPIAKQALVEICGEELTLVDDVIKNAKVREYVQAGLDAANKKALSRASMVKKWRFLPQPFSLAGGEFTPTMKLKRRVVLRKYKDLIDEIYVV